MAVNNDQIRFVASLLTDDPDIILETGPEPLVATAAPQMIDQDEDVWSKIEPIVTQPWESWARLLDSNVSAESGRWDDPGEYPSGAGSGPLPSYNYLESLDGKIVFEIIPELTALFDQAESDGPLPYNEFFEGSLTEIANEHANEELPGIHVMWDIVRQGNKIIFSARDFDASEVEMPDSGRDWDDY